jgi:hypothetical protein
MSINSTEKTVICYSTAVCHTSQKAIAQATVPYPTITIHTILIDTILIQPQLMFIQARLIPRTLF